MSKNLLGAYLKEARTRAGLSQSDVSTKLGYSTSQFVSNWERGLSSPPVESLKRLEKMYGIPAERLFEVTLNEAIQRVTAKLRKSFAKTTSGKQLMLPGVKNSRGSSLGQRCLPQ